MGIADAVSCLEISNSNACETLFQLLDVHGEGLMKLRYPMLKLHFKTTTLVVRITSMCMKGGCGARGWAERAVTLILTGLMPKGSQSSFETKSQQRAPQVPRSTPADLTRWLYVSVQRWFCPVSLHIIIKPLSYLSLPPWVASSTLHIVLSSSFSTQTPPRRPCTCPSNHVTRWQSGATRLAKVVA